MGPLKYMGIEQAGQTYRHYHNYMSQGGSCFRLNMKRYAIRL